jgi:excisionase family DNA binding protein
MTVINFDEIMSLKDVCAYLKLAKSTAYLLAQRGDLPASVVGRQLRFRKTKIDQWLDQQEVKKKRKSASGKLRRKLHR